MKNNWLRKFDKFYCNQWSLVLMVLMIILLGVVFVYTRSLIPIIISSTSTWVYLHIGKNAFIRREFPQEYEKTKGVIEHFDMWINNYPDISFIIILVTIISIPVFALLSLYSYLIMSVIFGIIEFVILKKVRKRRRPVRILHRVHKPLNK